MSLNVFFSKRTVYLFSELTERYIHWGDKQDQGMASAKFDRWTTSIMLQNVNFFLES